MSPLQALTRKKSQPFDAISAFVSYERYKRSRE